MLSDYRECTPCSTATQARLNHVSSDCLIFDFFTLTVFSSLPHHHRRRHVHVGTTSAQSPSSTTSSHYTFLVACLTCRPIQRSSLHTILLIMVELGH